MLRLIPRRRLAFFVLVTLLGGVIAPLFGDLHAEVDRICSEETWAGTPHHQTTQIEGVRPPVSHDHCAACHLQRVLGGAADDGKRLVVGQAAAPSVVGTGTGATRDRSRHDVPSRAPPLQVA